LFAADTPLSKPIHIVPEFVEFAVIVHTVAIVGGLVT
jgi:hypothetical protein